jgi:6-phosphogluconolactonase/glucosamine-6-phosphate isomerase/deaminase
MQKEKFFIISAGGYLPKPIVEEIVVDESEMDDDFVDFDDYKNHILDESVAESEQRFARAIILTEAQAKEISVYLTTGD